MLDGLERTNRGVILVVDDDENVRASYSRFLGAFGYEVVSAPEGCAALSLLSQGFRPDLILLDLRMPGVDGWATTEILAADPALNTIPVIVTTGWTPDRPLPGCRALLEKPVETHTLLQLLQQHLPAAKAA